MQYVTVHEIRGGEDTVAGTISFDGIHLIPNPPHDPVLIRLIEDVQGSPYPLDDLHAKFRGIYLHTSPPQNVENVQPA